MKTLSAGQETQRTARAKGIFNLLKIEWPSPEIGTIYYSTRAKTSLGAAFAPGLAAGEVLQSSLLGWPEFNRGTEDVSLPRQNYEVTILDDEKVDLSRRIETILNYLPTAVGIAVTAYMMFEPASGGLSSSDWIHLGLYRIVDYTMKTDRATLVLENWIEQPGRQLVGKRITADDFPTAPESSLGLLIPIVFGTVPDSPCPLVTSGARTTLSGDVGVLDTTIAIESLTGFGTSGTVVIDSEMITYAAVDVGNSTLGTGGSPVTRGAESTDVTAHDSGGDVRLYLGLYRAVVAWHHVLGEPEPINVKLKRTGELIYQGGAAVTETTLNGHDITYIDLSALPRIVRRTTSYTIHPLYGSYVHFLGGGLDDLSKEAIDYDVSYPHMYNAVTVTIASEAEPDTFDWSDMWGIESGTGVSIPGGDQVLGNTGLTIKFDATTGHTLNDETIIAWFVRGNEVETLHFPTEDEVIIIANVNGITDPYEAPDEVLSKPGNVIRHLIEGDDFFGIDIGCLDTSSLDTAISDVGGNIRFDRRIYQQISAMDLLESAAWQCGILLFWENGKIYASAGRVADTPANSVATLSRTALLTRTERRIVRQDADIVNKVRLHYKQSFVERAVLTQSAFDAMVESEDARSQLESWGVREQEFSAPWIRDDTAAQELADHLRDEHSWRTQRVVMTGPLDWIHLERGDEVTLDDGDALVSSLIGRIEEIGFPRPYRTTVVTAVTDRRTRIWKYDANNYIDAYAGGVRWVFVVGGVIVARIDDTSRLRLKGNIQELPYTSETEQVASDSTNGEIEYVAGNSSIGFGVKRVSDSKWVTVAELLPNGKLRIWNSRDDPTFPVTLAFSAWYEWKAATNSLDFTLDRVRSFMRFARGSVGGITNAKLHVRKIMENAL